MNDAEIVRDFIPNSLRTLSPGFSGSKVPVIAIINAVSHFRQSAERLDDIKKTLFYDKPEAFARLRANMPLLGVDPNAPEVLCLTHDISDYDKNVLHALLGIFTEAGELAEALERMMVEGAELDETNLKEECGDIFWYVAVLFAQISTTFPAEMDRVVRKLQTRFPDKFTNDAANVRDLEAERATLESDGVSGKPFHDGHKVSPRTSDMDDVCEAEKNA